MIMVFSAGFRFLPIITRNRLETARVMFVALIDTGAKKEKGGK